MDPLALTELWSLQRMFLMKLFIMRKNILLCKVGKIKTENKIIKVAFDFTFTFPLFYLYRA